jgi:hypothetical protein
VADDHDRLSQELERWRAADQQREKRETEWKELQRLLRHATGLAILGSVEAATNAIHDGRQLLDDPDPVKPVLTQLSDALRVELRQLVDQLARAQREAIDDLASRDEWAKLSRADTESIIQEAKLVSSPPPDISTASKLLESLDAVALSGWQDRINLVPSRRDQAWQRAAKQLEPESVAVTPPAATIRTAAELDAYLALLREQVVQHLDAKKTVII